MIKPNIGLFFAKSKLAAFSPALQSLVQQVTEKLSETCNLHFAVQADSQLQPETHQNIDALCLFPLTGGTEQVLQNVAQEWRKPIVLYGNESRNSMASAIELREYLRDRLVPTKLVNTVPDAMKSFHFFAQHQSTLNEFANLKLGLVGEISPWLINERFLFPYEQVPMSSFLQTYHQVSNEVAWSHVERVVQNASERPTIEKDDLVKAGKSYVALKKIVQQRQWHGFTMGCFDLLDELRSTPCLAVSLFNSDPAMSAAGCEGELNSLLALVILKRFFQAPVFMANFVDMNLQQNQIRVAHCTAPLVHAQQPYKLVTHFESNQGVSFDTQMPFNAPVSVLKIKGRRAILTSALALPPAQHSELQCRTQMRLQMNKVEPFVEQTFGNHHIISYVDTDQLQHLLELLQFDVLRI